MERFNMYAVVKSKDKYEIHIKGLIKMNLRPFYVTDDKNNADDVCEILNVAYQTGYNNGLHYHNNVIL